MAPGVVRRCLQLDHGPPRGSATTPGHFWSPPGACRKGLGNNPWAPRPDDYICYIIWPRRLHLLHIEFCIFQKLILGSRTFWAPRPDDYICYLSRDRRLHLLHIDFFIFQKLILGSRTFWTPRPDDYICYLRRPR